MKEIKLQQLRENYNEYRRLNAESYGEEQDNMSFSNYVIRESENDPGFFAWFFDDENLDSISSLSNDQYAEWQNNLVKICSEDACGPCEIHLGLTENGKSYIVDVIDKDGNIYEDYSKVEADNRQEAEKSARELFENDNVIFDY